MEEKEITLNETKDQSLLNAIAAIVERRKAQDVQWGGPKNDDAKPADDWLGIIREFLDKCQRDTDHGDPGHLREHLIDIAAVSTAFIEVISRKLPDLTDENLTLNFTANEEKA